jgi:cellobiose phosphorylase
MKPDPSKPGTVYEHALMAVKSLASHTGHHGLCKIGYGDWNDALSGIGGSCGVSVWLSCACVHAARTMASIAEKRGAGKDANDMNSIAERISDAVNGHGWDGRWYVYAIDDAGRPVGSKKCREGKMHLNVNAWAIFTGIAQKADREEQVWKSLESLDTPLGHLLLAPSYTAASRKDVGRIADILPGMFENGSIYLHGESFFLYALARSGKADECFTKLLRVLPSSMIQDIATGPRHQQSNFTVGPDHPQFGTQLFSNSTGSLSWFRRIITELVGVKPGFDSLQIAFSAPESWNGHEVFKVWRGRRIRIKFSKAKAGKPRGIFLDGKRYDAEIPLGDFSKAGTNIVTVDI